MTEEERLKDAAPNMLHALLDFIHYHNEPNMSMGELLRRACDAVEKALGYIPVSRVSDGLKPFTVIYHDNPDDITPQAFQCQAENIDHAEEQCLNAYPNCVIAWVNIGHTDAIAKE